MRSPYLSSREPLMMQRRDGESVASGVYFYTLTAGDFTATRKMLILEIIFLLSYGL